ncbi:TPA: phage tail tape measure protein [Enterobacter soli]|nr:phage tail tape measure protein [Enterobacter soli]
MKQLDFTLSLIDKLTRPLKQAQNSVKGFADQSQKSFRRIGLGAVALWGVGQTIKGALSPAIEMYDALNDASARGISSKALATVRKDAMLFSTAYGTSAVDFVNSTADINGAIAGLTETELPKVTKVANTLAFSLRATTAETSEFMGQMFANFQSDADRLGKVQFAEQLAGKMTYMRQVFGVEMGTIKDLMEGARGVGNNFNIGIDEQLAVLGQLQRSLGTEASGAYESFMTGAIDGAKKLGLSFQDATGNILSMPEMLEKLQGKYGKSLEGNLKAQAELDAAFGGSSAVVKQLYGNVALLQRNITELGGSDGLKRTQEMAAKMVKPWDRFVAILRAIQTVIGLTLIPVLYPMLNRLADMGATFARWMQIFPNIARVVGYVVMGILSFAAAGALLNIAMGISTFVMTGWGAILTGLRGVLMAVRGAAMLAALGINLMSWPVLLIIGAIALLVAGCYLLVKHWDAIKTAVMNTEAFQTVAAAVQWVADVFAEAWQFITQGWDKLVELMTLYTPFDYLADVAKNLVGVFDNVWTAIKGSFLNSWNWIVEKLNKIPGVDIALAGDANAPSVTQNTLSTGGQVKAIEKGGISKSINNTSKTVVDKGNKIGTVNIYPKETLTPGQLAEWQELG